MGDERVDQKEQCGEGAIKNNILCNSIRGSLVVAGVSFAALATTNTATAISSSSGSGSGSRSCNGRF